MEPFKLMRGNDELEVSVDSLSRPPVVDLEVCLYAQDDVYADFELSAEQAKALASALIVAAAEVEESS